MLFDGAGGTPSSLTGTNITGTALAPQTSAYRLPNITGTPSAQPTGIIRPAQDMADPSWKPPTLADVPAPIMQVDPAKVTATKFGITVNEASAMQGALQNPKSLSPENQSILAKAIKAGVSIDSAGNITAPAAAIPTLNKMMQNIAKENGASIPQLSAMVYQKNSAAIDKANKANEKQMTAFNDRLKSEAAPSTVPVALMSPVQKPSYALPDITGTPNEAPQSYLKDVSSYSGTQPTEKQVQGMSATDQLKADLAAIKGGPRPRAPAPPSLEKIVAQPDATAADLAPSTVPLQDKPTKMGKVKSFAIKAGVNAGVGAIPGVGVLNTGAGLFGKSAGDLAVEKLNEDANRPFDPNAPKTKTPTGADGYSSHGTTETPTASTPTETQATSETGRPMDYYYWDIGYNVPKDKADPKWSSYQTYLKTRLVK